MTIFEVRNYTVKQGAMDEWVDFMETKILPFSAGKGMKVDATFRGVDDPNAYVWIRRFDDEEHRKALYKALYGSTEWKEVYKPTVERLLEMDKIQVQVVQATGASPLK